MTRTKTIGEILKTEREHHSVDLDALARRTRIKRHYLEALENNRFDQLPASAFVKGYIKTYAQTFGFDHQPLLALLRRDFKESARGSLVPQDFIKPVLKHSLMWTPVTIAFWVLATAFITLISYIGVQYYNLQKPPYLMVAQPQEDQVVASQVIVTGQSVPDSVVTVNAQVVRLNDQGNFTYEVFLPKEGLSSITVESTDRRGKKNTLQRTVRVEF